MSAYIETLAQVRITERMAHKGFHHASTASSYIQIALEHCYHAHHEEPTDEVRRRRGGLLAVAIR